MNISGIRPIGGYASIGSLSSISRARSASAESAASGNSLSAKSNAKEDLQKIAEKRARQTFTVNDFDAQYRPENPFGENGSRIRTADVEKAVSDMRRDEVLQQYQYFVGTSDDPSKGGSSPDQTAGSIRGAENFTF